MLPVVGTITYRLQIHDSSSEVAIRNAKKRKRQEPRPRDSFTTTESVADFFLLSDQQAGSQFSEYLLLIPLCLSKVVAEAAEKKLPVVVSNYSLMVCRSENATVPVLELRTNGLKLQHQFVPSLPDFDSCLSLSQLAKKEIFEEKYMDPTLRIYHNVVATIDAVSPVIALDPSNPFALVELYDKRRQDFCCTLVLRGFQGLIWHDALHPGDTWYFTNLSRQRWQVPKVLHNKQAFRHLDGRIPSFVLTFSTNTKIVHASRFSRQGNLCTDIPPLPSTIRPLVSIQGRIVGFEEASVVYNNASHHISWIDIVSEANDTSDAMARCCRVFVQHFPMSRSLRRSLQPGAVVRAVNIHLLNQQLDNSVNGFGACLRTTISMIQGPAESCLKNTSHHPNESDVANSHFVPLFFGKVSLSYQDVLAVNNATKWLERSFLRRESYSASVPDIKDVLQMAACGGTFPRKLKTRNPYAEFFDHGHSESQQKGYQPEVVGGCTMTQNEIGNAVAPTFIGLKDLLAACEDILVARFTSLLSIASIKSSWVGSLHLSPIELFSGIEAIIYTGGHVKHVDSFACPTSIADCDCVVPLRCNSMKPVPQESFIISEMKSVLVSVFCLDAPVGNDTSNLQQPRVTVMPLPASDISCGHSNTGLTMLCIDRHVLIASVQVRCDAPKVISSGTGSGHCIPREIPPADTDKPIHEYLEVSEENVIPGNHCRGILTRHRFRIAKANTAGLCKSLILTVASLESPDSNSGEVFPVLIPSVKINVTVPISTAMVVTLKQCLDACMVAVPSIPEEQYVLGANWWKVAEAPATSPLVCGGWDEHVLGASGHHVAVVVRLPTKSFELARRGFIRVNCDLGYLETSFQNAKDVDRARDCTSSAYPFSFVGSRQFYDGMLDRRPSRMGRTMRSHTLGPMVNFHSPFTPIVTISDLFFKACETIKNGKPLTSPSVVWRVSGADLLGINFCQARCMCGVCFEPLQRSTGDRRRSKNNRFSHPKATTGRDTSNCMLTCPNQCPSQVYEVVWECTGTLDDGTGQAKLHAEREAALSLLQISHETIEQVEWGIWYLEDGTILFNQTIPPPRELKSRLDWAILQGYRENVDPMTLLDGRTKAEYALHEHCRTVGQRPRDLDYLVRCKPMADHVVHLTHTMLETRVQSYRGGKTEKRDIPTYGLPIMRLQLVDCCIRK